MISGLTSRLGRVRSLLLVFVFAVIISSCVALYVRVLQAPDVQAYDFVVEDAPFVVHAAEFTYRWNGRDVACTLLVQEEGYDSLAVCEPRDIYAAKQWMVALIVVLSAFCGGLLTRILMIGSKERKT